jgi:hypothetical protein
MTSAGFDSQVGYAIESPSGTFTAPTFAVEHVKSSLKLEIDRIPSKGIKAGRRHQGRWFPGAQRVKGNVQHEMSAIGMGKLFRTLMGAVNTTGSGPYQHVYTPGVLTQTNTLTVQVGTPDVAGTINVLSFLGCHIVGMTITSKVGEAAMVDIEFYGQHLDVGQSLTAASYSSTWAPLTFLQGVLSIAGSEYEFDDITLSYKNGLRTDRHVHRSTTPARPKTSLESGFREWTATVNSDFHSLTALNRAIAGTEAAFSLVFTSGANTLTFAGNARSDVDSPVVDGPETLKNGLPLVFLSTTSDAAAMTITQVTTESSP